MPKTKRPARATPGPVPLHRLRAWAPELAALVRSGADQLDEWSDQIELRPNAATTLGIVAGMRAVADDYRDLLARIGERA